MPYNSKVSILCGTNVGDRILALPDLFGASVKMRKDGLMRFYWDEVRWEPDADEKVAAVMNIVDASTSSLINGDYENRKADFCSFLRLGDYVGDDESRNNTDYFERQWINTVIDITDDEPMRRPGCMNTVCVGHTIARHLRRIGAWPTT